MGTRTTAVMLGLMLSSVLAAGQKIEKALQAFATGYPAEKLHLHFDRETYIAGETIWFKAYILSDGLPVTRSSTLYVQLLDADNSVVKSLMVPVAGATAKGNIDLPDSLPEGNYYVRAATPYMLNFGPANVYRSNIYIHNPSAVSPKLPVAAPRLQLHFFPESGPLVDGLLTVVAFKATDGQGNPVDLSGVIRSEDGTTICSFSSRHDGMGRTQFRPAAGKRYHAEVEYMGQQGNYPLPAVESAGVNLKIQDEEGGKVFLLSRRESEKGMFQVLSLVAQMNSRIVYEAEIDMEDYPSVKGHLITDSLPSGILHFTVFNKDGIPIAERLSFVNNREYAGAGQVMAGKTGLGSKEENHIELSFPEPIQRSLSISVTDERAGTTGNEDHIWSSLLLTGELGGRVFNPAYYFQNSVDSVVQAMDNLMLTQGWSRFSWSKILADEFPAIRFRPAPYLSFSGTVREGPDKPPVDGGTLNIYAESADSSSRNYQAPVNQIGRFGIDSALYFGNTRFYYAYTNDKGKKKSVVILPDPSAPAIPGDSSFTNARGYFSYRPPARGSSYASAYEWLKDEKQRIKVLDQVVLESRTSKKPVELVNEKYATGVFKAMGKVNIDNITQPSNDRSGNVLDFIKNRIQQVELQGNRFVSRKNFSLMSGQKWAVDVFIDEVPSNASFLRNLRVDEIALVKYFEAGFVGVGSSSPGGAIAVWTKTRDAPPQEVEKLEHFTLNGYSVTRQFYHPDYSLEENRAIPDKRITLYWNPDVYMDSDSESVSFSFYHNDLGKRYRVVVEGFDAKGKLVHVEKWIE